MLEVNGVTCLSNYSSQNYAKEPDIGKLQLEYIFSFIFSFRDVLVQTTMSPVGVVVSALVQNRGSWDRIHLRLDGFSRVQPDSGYLMDTWPPQQGKSKTVLSDCCNYLPYGQINVLSAR